MEQWQAMHRDTGKHIGTPRTASQAEMEDRAARLPGVVWYSLTSGTVVYAPYSARDRYRNGWADVEAATEALKAH